MRHPHTDNQFEVDVLSVILLSLSKQLPTDNHHIHTVYTVTPNSSDVSIQCAISSQRHFTLSTSAEILLVKHSKYLGSQCDIMVLLSIMKV